jgi:aminopeptidase
MRGARNAVGTCLGIKACERVALIADQASAGVAASLEAALAEYQAQIDAVLIEAVAERPMRSAPQPILDALEHADAGILCVQPQEGELPARMAIVGLVERRRIRYAHMVGVTPEIMREGLEADYRLVDRLSQQLCERMRTASRLTVKTPAGTDFIATFDPSLIWVKTSGLINPRYWSNLPAGEVFTTPAAVDGTFVCDGTAGDYFNGKYGSLEATPLTLEIREGRLVDGSPAGLLGLLPHRREQRPRRRARLRHQHRPAPDDRHPPSGRKVSGRAPRVRRSLRQPDARRLEVAHARRRPDARLQRLDRRRAGDCRGEIPARSL